MSDTTVTIGGNNVSNYVIDVDVGVNKKTGIGTADLVLNNDGDTWGDTFTPNDEVNIAINGGQIFHGYVDDVIPVLEKKGVNINQIRVRSRSDGRILTDYYLTKDYDYQPSGEIIDDILAELGDPLLYTDPGGTPSIKYSCQRTFLADALFDISNQVGYDFYVDVNGRLQFFPAGTVDSGVNLTSVVGSATNNLLSFEEYESIGTDIKNVVEVHVGSLKDHWTEGNKDDFDVLAGTMTVSNETTVKLFNATSIKLEATADDGPYEVVIDLSDGKYSQGGEVNLTTFSQAKVAFIPKKGSVGNFSIRPMLIDTSARKIKFYRTLDNAAGSGYTQNQSGSLYKWRALTFPIGEHVGNVIDATDPGSGHWEGDTDFDWEHVEQIGFYIVFPDYATMNTLFIDSLYFPNIEVKSIQQDAASIAAYGTRMATEYKKELLSQIELDVYAAKRLAQQKDPVKKFKAVAVGQTGTKYASQVVDVQAPTHGIAALTPYVIVSLNHKLHYDEETRGWDYVTSYELTESDVHPDRVLYDDNPMAKLLQRLREENRGYKGSIYDADYWLGTIDPGTTTQVRTGATFPTDYNDGDLFFLTADYLYGATQYYGPAQYKYVASTDTWIRDPMVMYRAAQPPAGGEMSGDYYYNTTTDIMYQWTGAAWVALDFDATVISGTLSSSQLKKGIQPFDSSVFFYPIRTNASNTVTFDIDVDNGAGKAVITASAGTPFSYFTAGDDLIIQGCEDSDNDSIVRSVDSVGGGGSSITLDSTLGGADTATDETCIVSARDAVRWVGANPAIYFADGTSRQVTSGDVNGLALGSHWVYFSTADTSAHVTATYGDAVGDTVGIICRLEITSDAEPLIMPVYSRGGNMTLDFLGAGAVDTLVLTSDAIIGKDFRTSAGAGVTDAGVMFDKTGIYGYNATPTQTFSLTAADGLLTVGGTQILRFYDTIGGNLRGWIGGGTFGAIDAFHIRSNNAPLYLDANGDIISITAGGDVVFDDDFGSIRPNNTGTVDLGTFAKQFGNIYGAVKYSDIYFQDMYCPKCGEKFKRGDDIKLRIISTEWDKDSTGYKYEQIRCVPEHVRCSKIALLKKTINNLKNKWMGE